MWRWRFSTRGLFVLMATLAIALAVVGGPVRRFYAQLQKARDQERAVETLKSRGGLVTYEFYMGKRHIEECKQYARDLEWASWLGYDFMFPVRQFISDDSSLSDAHLLSLRELPDLLAVGLTGPNLTDQALEGLRGSRVRRLYLSGQGFTDRGLAVILTMPDLQDISLEETSISPQGVRSLEAQGVKVCSDEHRWRLRTPICESCY